MNDTQSKYNTLATEESIKITVSSLEKNNFKPQVIDSKDQALDKIKELIPSGATIMNGTSTTLAQIGFIDLLKSGKHDWVNLHEQIINEKDPVRQEELRKMSVMSDYYLGSAHAVDESGEIFIASNTGSQLPYPAFTSKNIILVISTKKIVSSFDEAFRRIDEHVVPLEDERALSAYGVNTMHAKTLILHKENPKLGRNVYVILVKEDLGF